MIRFGTFFLDKMKKNKKRGKTMKKRPKSFVLYTDFEDALLKMSLNERGILITMIFSYVNRGAIDENLKRTSATDAIFTLIRPRLDRDAEKYERICLRNAQNGSCGGRPRGKT